jgi:RHS repeat-associated protein
VKVILPQDLGANADGATRLESDDGWVQTWLEGAQGTGRVDGSMASYEQALPGVDVTLASTPDGIKERLVLGDVKARRSFAYRLRLSDGLHPVVDGAGAVTIERGDRRVFSIPRATLVDSRPGGAPGPAPEYALRQLGGDEWRIELRLDDAWLDDASRQWPVTVDPTTSTTSDLSASTECQIGHPASGTQPTVCNDPNHDTMLVGVLSTPSGGLRLVNQQHVLIDFPSLSSVLATDDVVDEARLFMYTTAGNPQANQRIQVAAADAAWNSSVTWSTAPAGKDPLSVAAPGTGIGSVNVVKTVADWQAHRLNASNGAAQFGFRLSPDQPLITQCDALDPDCPNGVTTVASNTNSDVSKRPYLEIVSMPTAPAGAKIVTPEEGDATGRRVPLRVHAPNSTVDSVRFQYVAGTERYWQDIPASALRYDDGSAPSSTDVSVAAGNGGGVDSRRVIWDLQNTTGGNIDGSLHVRAILDDPTLIGGGVTPPVSFRLDRRNPQKDATEDIGPGTLDLLTGDFTMTTEDASVDAWLGDLTVSRTYHSRGVSTRTAEMFGPQWAASVDTDGGAMPYKSLYNYSQIDEQTVTNWVQAPVTHEFEIALDFGEDDEPDPFSVYGELTTDEWTPVTDTLRWEYHYAVVELNDGGKITFKQTLDPDGNVTGWEPDDDHPGLKIEKAGSQWTLTDEAGAATTFEADAVDSPSYHPTQYKQPGSTQTPTFTWETVSGRLRLTKITAPNVTSSINETRYVRFDWKNDSTTGNQPRVVTIYGGRRSTNSTAPVSEVAMALYSYDSSGRLIQVSDPRVPGGLPVNYAYDSSDHLATVTPPGEAAWELSYTSVPGDANNGRLSSVTRARPDSAGEASWTVAYGVPLSGAGAPRDMDTATLAQWAEVDDLPTDATAIFPPSHVPAASPPTSWTGATIHYLDANGLEVNTAEPGGSLSTTQYDSNGNVQTELTATNRERALAAVDSVATAQSLMTIHHYRSNGVDEDSVLGPTHDLKLTDSPGTVVRARTKTVTSYDAGPDPNVDYHLPTSVSVFALYNNSSKDIRRTAYSYESPWSTSHPHRGWELRKPTQVIVDPDGSHPLTTTTIYDDELPLVKEVRSPNYTGPDSHVTVYGYCNVGSSSGGTVGYGSGLICSKITQRKSTDPPSPAHLFFYDANWNLICQMDVVSMARVTNFTYDAADRLTGVTIRKGPFGSSYTLGDIPSIATTYDAATGRLATTRSNALGSEPVRTISRMYDSNGRLISYTDPSGAQTTNSYDIDGLLSQQTDPKGTTTFGYDDRGLLTTVVDSTIGTAITGSYDADGQLIEETLPNGLTAQTTYNEAGDATDRTYVKSSCSTACNWVEEHLTLDAYGRWVKEMTGDRTRTFQYDAPGRLRIVQDVPDGGNCTTRLYAYDDDSNRTSRSTYPAASGGACSTSTMPTVQSLSYDSADRINNPGFAYDSNWNEDTTTVPGSVIGSGLTATYFVNDRTKTLTQNGVTQTYSLDPLSRILARQSSGSVTGTESSHYGDDSDAPSWIATGTNTWTRYITGLSGDLVATSDDAGTVTYPLSDLHGDTVAQADSSTTATAPTSTSSYDEFGAPDSTTLQKYGWLGGKQRPEELASGVIGMGARTYIPQLGRFLQVDPVDGGSANAYDYANQDPVNQFDLDGRCVPPVTVVCAEVVVVVGGAVLGAVAAKAVHDHIEHHPVSLPHFDPFFWAKKKSRGGPGQTPTGPARSKRFREYHEKKHDKGSWTPNANKRKRKGKRQ